MPASLPLPRCRSGGAYWAIVESGGGPKLEVRFVPDAVVFAAGGWFGGGDVVCLLALLMESSTS